MGKYKTDKEKDDNYDKSIKKVAQFDDLIDFW